MPNLLIVWGFLLCHFEIYHAMKTKEGDEMNLGSKYIWIFYCVKNPCECKAFSWTFFP